MPPSPPPADAMAARRAELAQRHDHELVDKLMRFARSQLGEAFMDEVIETFTARGAGELVDGELQILAAQMAAWLSLWQVERVDPCTGAARGRSPARSVARRTG